MNIISNETLDKIPEGYEALNHYGNYYHHILTCLGYPKEQPPVAELLRRFHELEGKWLVVSPIFWQATHNDGMIIASGDELSLSDEEGLRWFDAFQAWMALENTRVFYHDANTWLISCDDKPPIHAKPVYTLHNRSLISELRQLDNTLYWQRLITEAQMFLSEHPLNKERGDVPEINGLWFWGEGELREKTSIPIVYSDDFSMRLARILSTTVVPLKPPFREDSLVLFHSTDSEIMQLLDTGSQKSPSYWFWNNLAYMKKKKKNWLARCLNYILQRGSDTPSAF